MCHIMFKGWFHNDSEAFSFLLINLLELLSSNTIGLVRFCWADGIATFARFNMKSLCTEVNDGVMGI